MRTFPFEEVIQDASAGNVKIQKGDYLTSGEYPIVDQGQEFIGGFTSSQTDLVKGEGPWIVFGDHTRALKFFETPFCMGADGVKVLQLKQRGLADLKYVFHFLKHSNIPSAGYSRHYKFLKRLEIPLPPLDEQKRIAAILDKADELRAKRRKAIALLDSLTQSIFLAMFGDPVSNPKGLQKESLGALIKVSSGNGLTSAQMDTDGIYNVYGGNGVNGRHSRYMFDDPQIAIGRVGVYCGAVHVTARNSWITDNALYVSKMSPRLSLRYLAEALRLADLNQYAGRAAQPLISGSRIYPVEILVPPLDEQGRFERNLLSSEATRLAVDESRKYLESNFAALQHRAFSGQL